MYTIDDRDEVVVVTEMQLPDIGAPMPRLTATEHEVNVTYYVREDGDRETTVRFSGLWALMLGPPNDEAFESHPLAARGLIPYGAFEVKQSSWIRSLERVNRIHPSHRPEAFKTLRHFVISFHDTTFECIAEGATCDAIG